MPRRALSLLFLAVAACLAQTTPPLDTQLDRTVSSMRQAFSVPSVSVAVIENGQLTYAKAFGESDLARQQSATPESRYAVGSISKQFTAAALLLEQEAGKLSLDDKVARYLPDLTRATEVTIRELLSHTSGYEDYAPQDYLIPSWTEPTTPQAILDHWAKKPLNFTPGTEWQYSNTNYVIAGTILEKVSGEKLLPFLREHFFNPLHMASADDCFADTGSQDATAYTRYALGPPRPVGREGAGWYFAAGELCMTPTDLAKWDQAFLARKILSARSYDEFTREVKLKNGKSTHYALGLSVEDWKGTRRISHSGEVSGFLASNTIFPDKHAGVIVLTNEDGVTLIGPLSQEIGSLLIDPKFAKDEHLDSEVRAILEDLQKGDVPRDRLTDNARSYFSQEALHDYQTSLEPLGKLEVLSRQSTQSRGGMTHLSYRAHFQKDTVSLNIYLMPDGKFEQFMVEEQF